MGVAVEVLSVDRIEERRRDGSEGLLFRWNWKDRLGRDGYYR